MKSWYSIEQKYIETPEKLKDFFDDIETTCKRYGLTIGYSDWNESFVIEEFFSINMRSLREAQLSKSVSSNDELTSFLNRIESIFKKYGLSISHQYEGVFQITKTFNLEDNMKRLRGANINFKL